MELLNRPGSGKQKDPWARHRVRGTLMIRAIKFYWILMPYQGYNSNVTRFMVEPQGLELMPGLKVSPINSAVLMIFQERYGAQGFLFI